MVSSRGATRLITFEQNLTAVDFVEYLEDLKKDADKLYRRKKYRIVIDGDSKHTANDTQKYIKKEGLDVVARWPANSPDLNPIENIWGIMEKEIKKLHIMNSLKIHLNSIWRRITTPERLKPLIDSMEERMKRVLASKGSKIDY